MILDHTIDVRYIGLGTDDEPPQVPQDHEVALAFQNGVDCSMGDVVASQLMMSLFERHTQGDLPGPVRFTDVAKKLCEAAHMAISVWGPLSAGSRHYFMLRWTKVD